MWYDAYERKVKQIKLAAVYYTEYKWSMKTVAENICVSETTVRRYLNKYLKHIDYELYVKAQKRKLHNKNINMFERDEKGRFRRE